MLAGWAGWGELPAKEKKVTKKNWIADGSAVKRFRENPEAFRLEFRQHLKPAGWNIHTDTGRAGHDALDAWFCNPESDLERMLLTLRRAWREEPLFHDGIVHPLSQMEVILQMYAEHYPRESDAFEVVETEKYWETDIARPTGPLTEPLPWARHFMWCGIVDRTIRWDDGSVYTMDTKFTGEWLGTKTNPDNPHFFQQFKYDTSQIGYGAMRLVHGLRWDGFYIDGIHRGKKTSEKPVATRDLFRFGPIKVPTWLLDRWAYSTEYTLGQIQWLDENVGPDQPWPCYPDNHKYGKIGAYGAFLEQAPESFERVARTFERQEWKPQEVAAR